MTPHRRGGPAPDRGVGESTTHAMTMNRKPLDAEARKAWVRREAKRRLAEETPNAPQQLLPLDRFPTSSIFAKVLRDRARLGLGGRPFNGLEAVIAGACNGWVRKPTVLEMEQAIRGRRSTRRARCLAQVVLTEADTTCIARAEAAGSFSLQDLVWWINEMKLPCRRRIRWLNALGYAWWLRQQRSPEKRNSRNRHE